MEQRRHHQQHQLLSPRLRKLRKLDLVLCQRLNQVEIFPSPAPTSLKEVEVVAPQVGHLETVEALMAQAGAAPHTHLRAHETPEHLVCRLLLEKKNNPH